ncbi:hypothetical protein PMAC_000664 [Pneumocystis sp. 'macacae']|nr:hypothetical protein PMAC_000664 [Pneumocystis sp. 'macacae']
MKHENPKTSREYPHGKSGFLEHLSDSNLYSSLFSSTSSSRSNFLPYTLCDQLRDAYGTLSLIDPRMDVFCNVYLDDQAYSGVLEGIITDVQSLYSEIQKLQTPSHEECRRLLSLCHFLQHLLPRLASACDKLALSCYRKIRKDTAAAILLRALAGRSETLERCKLGMEQVCVILSGLSQELRHACVAWPYMCRDLIATAHRKCTSLHQQLGSALTKPASEEVCLLVTDCTHYSQHCDDKTRALCKRLGTACMNSGYLSQSFLDDMLFVGEEEAKGVFNDVFDRYGVFIGTPPPTKRNSWDPSLSLLIQDEKLDPTAGSCYLITEECMFSSSDPFLVPLCTNGHGNAIAKDACSGYPARLTGIPGGYLDELTKVLSEFESVGLNFDALSAGIFPVGLTDDYCTRVQSLCYYYGGFGSEDLRHKCKKLESECYKKSYFSSTLKSILGSSYQQLSETSSNSESCVSLLTRKCKESTGLGFSAIYLCLHPLTTCNTLIENVLE